MTTLCLAELDSATLDLLGLGPEDRHGWVAPAHPARSSAHGVTSAPELPTAARSVLRLPLRQACAMPRDWRACIVAGQSS